MLCQYSGCSTNMRVLVNLMNLEYGVCVLSFMKFSLYQKKRRKTTWLSVLTFYMSHIHVEGSTSSVVVHAAGHARMWTHAELSYWLNP